jgi:transglutaminase-like putative cysteine protease
MRLGSRILGFALSVLGGSAPAGAFDPWTEPARYEIEYRADLASLGARSAEVVRVWLPTPAANAYQAVLSSEVEAPWPHRETRDRYGNRFVYLEGKDEARTGSAAVLRFAVERRPARGVSRSEARQGTPLDPQLHLGTQRKVPLDGVIREIAEQQSRGLETDAEKVRAFYDYVYRTMRYSKEGEGWGRGDAVWACTSRYGNCTDFHSLLLGMARSQGIPARFVIGFPIPPDQTEAAVTGYHCWAEVYEAERGWLPLDASEAWKAKRKDDYFGTLPSDRVEFTVGRDLVLEPPQQGEPVNYFIYPYAEVDGSPVASLPWTLQFRRVEPAVALGE